MQCMVRKGVVKKSREFFRTPPPPGVFCKNKAGTPCKNFFRQEVFLTVCYLNLHGTFTLPHGMTLAHEVQVR